MVLVHTRPSDDTTIDVIQWILSSGKSIFRVNTPDDLEYVQNALLNDTFHAAYFNGNGMMYRELPIADVELRSQIQKYLEDDIAAIWKHIFAMGLSKLPYFGSIPYSVNAINKLNVLETAKSFSIKVPSYELVYKRKRLIELRDNWGRVICKSLVDGVNIFTDEIIINGQRTEEILPHALSSLNDTFFPTFVQKLINKAYELRVFFFNGKFYSLAIFSQSRKQSTIDSRIIDSRKPLRKVPFLLPRELEQAICQMMSALNLNYGSLDFIVTPDQEFYFLEVNPYGQYGFLSKAGNFYIEKEIASYL